MSKQLEIQVAPDDLEFLKPRQYLLCFAKPYGNNDPAVVWQCFGDYLENNPLSWPPQYQLFGSRAFIVGGVAKIDTNTIAIVPGQQTTLNADAVFQKPVVSGPPEGLTIYKEYKQPIHLGFGSASTGPDGVQRITPIYLTPTPVTADFFTLTPVDIVRVWFQQNIVTSTIVGPTPQNSIEIDLRTRNSGKLRYQNGKWSEPSGG